MADIERVVYEALVSGGAPRPDRLTRLVAENIRREYGGSSLYINGERRLAIENRNREIREVIASGVKPQQAATRFGVSVSTIKRVNRLNK